VRTVHRTACIEAVGRCEKAVRFYVQKSRSRFTGTSIKDTLQATKNSASKSEEAAISARAWKHAGITRRVEYRPTHADDLLFVPEGRSARRRHARAHIAYPRGILLNSSRTSRRPGKHPVTPKETPVKFELNRPLGYLPRDLAKRYRQRKNHAHAVSVTASTAPICLTSYDPVSYFSASGRHEDARVQRPATFKVPSKRRTNESERSTNRPAIDPNQQHRRYDRTFSRPLVAREVRRQHGFQGRTVSEAGGGLRRS
jgi:hypothetical protein